MKILVTGGTGYIGSHTVVELQKKGFDVVVIDNLSRSSIAVLDNIKEITGKKPEFYQVDLTDKSALKNFFSKNKGIDAVIHFAAYKAVGESVSNPLLYYHNNLTSTIFLIEEMIENKINKIVFSSSCTVYGQPDKLPVTEETPIQAAYSPYGNTKQICEEIIQDSCNAYSFNGISLRYFNPIGAHETCLIGEYSTDKPENLVPYITKAGIGKSQDLKVFGDDYATPDGSCVRDYLHVVDLARAHVVALERIQNKENNERFEVFNLGTGKGNTVLEVIKMFEKVSGIKINYSIAPRRPGDVEKIFADTTKANNVLGWKAEYDLEEMIRSAWKWEQKMNKES